MQNGQSEPKCEMVILNVSFVVIWYGIQSGLICYISIILFNLKYLRIKSIRLICWNGSVFFLNWQMASNFCSPTVCKWIQQCWININVTILKSRRPKMFKTFLRKKTFFGLLKEKKQIAQNMICFWAAYILLNIKMKAAVTWVTCNKIE